MRLRLAFQLAVGPLRPSGEAVVHFTMRAAQGRILFDIAKIDFPHGRMYRLLDEVFDLSAPLARQLNRAVNQAIADLPKQDPRISKIEILELTP